MFAKVAEGRSLPGGVLYELASGELGAGGETSLALLLLFSTRASLSAFLIAWLGLRAQTASACRIRSVIASGCEISDRWLDSISIVFAPIRLAMNRSKSGLIVRSWVDTA
jgi:hypothetical protein